MIQRRVRRTAAQWADIIGQFERSGQPATVFCAEHGLAKATFARWRQRFADRPAEVQTFVPLVQPVEAPTLQTSRRSGPWALELDLGDGMTLRLQRG